MPGFRPVDPKQSFPELELGVLERWRASARLRAPARAAARAGAPIWSFYEGPPTANGKPGSHHVLSRAFKDVYPRYQAMRGHYVPRKAGWDCHGLPVELEIEKELGISSKAEIEEYGIAEFNHRCRESVFRYVEDWNRLTERIGFWIDLDDPYVTMTTTTSSRSGGRCARSGTPGRLYEGHKVVPYCPRCGTALSSHEVAQGYRDVEDPSVYVRFPVIEVPPTDAIPESAGRGRRHPARLDDDPVDADLQRRARRRRRRSSTCGRGSSGEVLDRRARRWSSACSARTPRCSRTSRARRSPGPATSRRSPTSADYGPRGHTVLLGDFVTTEDGTGLVHTAIAFGEDDFRLGEQYGITLQNPVRADGTFDERVTDFAGRFVKDADPEIVEALRAKRPAAARGGLRALLPALLALRHAAALLREVELVHPHDRRPRPDAGREREDRLAPRARQARPLRQVARGQRRLGALARALLGHAAAGLGVRVGRLRGASSAPARSPSCASAAARSRTTCTAPTSTRSPLRCEDCGGEMRRVEEVIDAWYDSGSMPFAQFHYPFEGEERVRRAVPGRLHLRGPGPDPRLVLLAARRVDAALRPDELPQLRLPRPDPRPEGQKMSTSRGNVVDPWAGDRQPRRRRVPLVLPEHPAALGRLPLLRRDGRRGGAPVPAHALEHVLVLRPLRERRGARGPRTLADAAARRSHGSRPLGRLAAAGR